MPVPDSDASTPTHGNILLGWSRYESRNDRDGTRGTMMTAAQVTDFFLALAERAGDKAHVEIDALETGERLGIHAPTVFSHVNDLTNRGWIERAPANVLGGLHVRLTVTGASRSGSERARSTGIAGRKAGPWKPRHLA
jgi:hypothetical protein